MTPKWNAELLQFQSYFLSVSNYTMINFLQNLIFKIA